MEKVGLRQFKLLVHDYKNNGRTMIFKIFIIMMTYVMMLYHMYDISYIICYNIWWYIWWYYIQYYLLQPIVQMREFRVSYFPRVNLLTKQHGQDLSPGHLRGLHHFIYGITVILCDAYFPENQLWGIMLLEMRVAVCLPFLLHQIFQSHGIRLCLRRP